MAINLIQELAQPRDNGIVIFISGLLFALSIFHFLLYFQNKNKVYLFYALYAFLVFVYSYHRANHFLLAELSKPIVPYLQFLYDPIKWLYSTVYLLFAINFIDLQKYHPKWNKFLNRFATISIITLIVVTFFSIVLQNKIITDYAYNFVFLPILFVLSLYILYLIWNTTSPVKYYLLIGAGFYLLVTSYSHYLTYTGHPFRVLFYFATAFEMILFALGLGKKQKILAQEKEKWHRMIIDEQNESLKLKDLKTKELDTEVNLKNTRINTLVLEKEKEIKKQMALVYSKQLLQLRLRAVQAQMNPHFLFNALNSIKNYIIKNNQTEAILYLTKFAKLIRLVLDYSNLAEISLKEELDLMKIYVEVENIRYDHTIQFDIIVDDDVDLQKAKTPPLILQTFLENSIWHGLSLKKGEKKLLVSIHNKNPYLEIVIQDNGIGRKRSMEINKQKSIHLQRESMGLKLAEERLKIYTQSFKNKYKIQIDDLYNGDNQPIGTRVILYLPIA